MRQMELGVELPSAPYNRRSRLKEEELALVAIALGIQQRKGGSIIKMLTDAAAKQSSSGCVWLAECGF